MYTANQLEYQRILDDLASIRSCITNFTGYVLGGSGILAMVLSFAHTSETRSAQIGFAALLGSVVISLVMLVLMYKFNSHNRMSAFIKVMSHEHIDSARRANDVFIAIWDICIGRLMHYSTPGREPASIQNSMREICRGINCKDLDREQIDALSQLTYCLTINPSPVDRARLWRGFKLIGKTFTGRLDSQSWSYPAYITLTFLSVMTVFIITGLLATGFSCAAQTSANGAASPVVWMQDLPFHLGCSERGAGSTEFSLLLITCVLVVIAQLLMWRVFVGKLYSLMQGSATVDSYFWRFLPIRGRVLTQMGFEMQYGHLRSWLVRSYRETVDQTGQRSD